LEARKVLGEFVDHQRFDFDMEFHLMALVPHGESVRRL